MKCNIMYLGHAFGCSQNVIINVRFHRELKLEIDFIRLESAMSL
jgi:hypothetical protein